MYIPLYNKSNYSLLSSLLTIDDIISFAIKNNMQSIAISDTNMYGTMEFIKKCEKNEIKPIIGLELNLNEFNIVLYAKDYNGYKSLIKLSTIQSERIIELTDLKEFNKSIIAIIEFKYLDKFNEITKIYEELYLGYSNKKEEQEARIITNNIIFFRESLYLDKNDEDTLSYLYLIRDGKTITDEILYHTNNYELKIANILALSTNDGLINTKKVANNCNVVFPKAKNLLPIFECDDPSSYLFELCKVGLNKRLEGKIPNKYKERLTYELKVINEMGFPNYFLIVYDFVKFAKKNKILVGPGRGSAA